MVRTEVKNERGAAAVELALVLPLLLMLLFGIIEFGRGYEAKVTLTHAARQAAREYAVNGGEVETVVEDATNGLSGDPVSIDNLTDLSTPCEIGDEVSVTLSYSMPYSIPFFNDGTFDITSTGNMRCGG